MCIRDRTNVMGDTAATGQLACANRATANAVTTAVALALVSFQNPQQAGNAAIQVQTLAACSNTAGANNLGFTQIDNTTGGTVLLRTCVNTDADGVLNARLILTG